MKTFSPKTLLAAVGLAMLSYGSAYAAEVKLGVAQALSGSAAKYGNAIKNGMVLATEEINHKGGVAGNQIKLVIEDEQGKKEEAINVYKKLIVQDKVLAVLGPTLSNSAFAANPIANQLKTVVFGTSNTADGITDIGPYSFRNSIMEADVLPVTVAAAVKKFGIKKVAVIYGNDDAFTKNGYEVFKKVLEKQKITVTTTETYAKGDVDFRAQLTKIKATNPDAIIASSLVEEAANILLQARQLGLKTPVIGGNGFNSPKLFEIAKEAADNIVIGSPWSVEMPHAANKALVSSYSKKFGVEPDQFAAQGYDAVYIVADALKRVKLSGDIAKDREALRLALPSTKIEGATGKFAFRKAAKGGDKVGYDAQQTPTVFISKGGKFGLLK